MLVSSHSPGETFKIKSDNNQKASLSSSSASSKKYSSILASRRGNNNNTNSNSNDGSNNNTNSKQPTTSSSNNNNNPATTKTKPQQKEKKKQTVAFEKQHDEDKKEEEKAVRKEVNEKKEEVVVPAKVDVLSTTTSTNTNMSTHMSTNNPSPFSQLELRDIQESFGTFDVDGTGRIVCGELREVLQLLQEEQQQLLASEEEGEEETEFSSPYPGGKMMIYPYLDQIVQELSTNYADTDTMDMNDYISLMERTTLQHRMMSKSFERKQQGIEEGNHDNYNDDYEKENTNHYAYVFSLFDIDNKGYITVEDLQRVAMYLGEQDMTRDELMEMIERGCNANSTSSIGGGSEGGNDDDESGSEQEKRVTLEQFTNIMTTKLYRIPVVPAGAASGGGESNDGSSGGSGNGETNSTGSGSNSNGSNNK